MGYMHETWGLISGIVNKHLKSVIWCIGETCDSELRTLKGRRIVVWPDSGPITDETTPSEVILKKGKLQNIMKA